MADYRVMNIRELSHILDESQKYTELREEVIVKLYHLRKFQNQVKQHIDYRYIW